jgi:hypothetical protein
MIVAAVAIASGISCSNRVTIGTLADLVTEEEDRSCKGNGHLWNRVMPHHDRLGSSVPDRRKDDHGDTENQWRRKTL